MPLRGWSINSRLLQLLMTFHRHFLITNAGDNDHRINVEATACSCEMPRYYRADIGDAPAGHCRILCRCNDFIIYLATMSTRRRARLSSQFISQQQQQPQRHRDMTLCFRIIDTTLYSTRCHVPHTVTMFIARSIFSIALTMRHCSGNC